MNDYNLINSLLEDGSETSILKLKMIVDFKNISLKKIKEKNVNLFMENFIDIIIENYLNSLKSQFS